jgi:hypothetical protein
LPSFEDPYSAVTQQQDEQYLNISPARFQGGPFSQAFGKELIRMQATPFNTMRKREELKAQRNLLFERFLRNPLDTGLALKIKIIDDQVAAYAEQMEQERKAELSSLRFLSDPVARRHHRPNSKKLESRR